ncbi:2'-5' RNA ligase family protein [Paenibacillus sp. Soil787]|uniref:2'-5' RNA ligase family protein n=1 Tax=Paenibacillus sp. Soil787 TaxID=1736411 RepID=UPI000702A6ED|nr:2'-5' RNA ligase family protein [Paenibacillus sp. Soil787]KRF21733.1 2'-5' RNA ligase [Paenibacillus sp. Soil787]
MQYFIGVVPPLEYMEKIICFQKNWKSNGVINVVEPHITLKAQGGLTPDIRWLGDLEKLCREISPFRIILTEPKFFGDYVVYLSMQSEELYQLHNKIVKLINPSNELIKKYFELQDFVPHLTLGKTFFGMSSNELNEMAIEARRLLTPYPTFVVDQIRVYQEFEPLKYISYKDIALKQ